MQVTVRVVDRVALAERVEAVALARVHLPRERQRVEYLAQVAHRAGRFGQPRQLCVEEGDVKRCVVDHELGPAHELDPLRGDVRKARLPGEELGGEAMHLQRARVDLAVRVQVAVEHAPGAPAVHDLDAADLDDAVAEFGSRPVVSVSRMIWRTGSG